MSGRIFLSYSHKDKEYVHNLANWLQRAGFNAWFDDRIDYGEEWPRVIEKMVDDCSACIVLMSQSAHESKWVQNELARAQRKRKPIFPLLLEGDNWISLEATQYVDVRGGRMPPKRFWDMLGKFSKSQYVVEKTPKANAKTKKKTNTQNSIYYLRWAVMLLIILISALFLQSNKTEFTNLRSFTYETSREVLSWFIIYLIIIPYWHFRTYKYSGIRGSLSISITLTIFLLGWLYNNWLGIIIISLPLLLIFLYLIFKIAQVILPTSDPKNSDEKWAKAKTFLAYIAGNPHSIWIPPTKTADKFDLRINGNPAKPGIVWMWSHQVAGLSKNFELNKIAGSSIVYTEPNETPVALVDLRTHISVITVDSITKDGIHILVTLLSAYSVDNEKWPKKNWTKDYLDT